MNKFYIHNSPSVSPGVINKLLKVTRELMDRPEIVPDHRWLSLLQRLPDDCKATLRIESEFRAAWHCKNNGDFGAAKHHFRQASAKLKAMRKRVRRNRRRFWFA